jgi:LmbE family N-acetylglucosaminyl deacetylase
VKRLFETISGARVLALGAHPDDIELGAGGLLARLAQHGAGVTMAVVSVPNNNDARTKEAEAGARILGARSVVLWGGEPCRVEDVPMHRLVARLDQLVAELTPHLVITHSAVDLHWDHRLVHHATISSLRRTPCDLLAYLSSPEMNAHARSIGQCFADISETIDLKLQAIGAHATQVDGGKFDLEATRDLARAMGRISGVQYAESYDVLRMAF